MIDLEEVADRIYRFETPLPSLNRILAVYIIREERGILFEPGPTNAIPFVLEGMKKLGIKEISCIIPTHIHMDHAGAIGKLTMLFPQAKVILHPSAVRHVVEPSRLIQGTKLAFGDGFEASWGPILPVLESQTRVLSDGERISIEGRDMKFVYAPGHAPHHIAIYDEETGGLFCGESLGVPRRGAESFPLPAVAPPSFDVEEYMGTIKKLGQLKPRILFYSHDGVGREPDKLIPKAEENMRVFGDIILGALKAGEDTNEIGHRVQEYIWSQVGVRAEESDKTMMVAAYTQYFKRKGLV